MVQIAVVSLGFFILNKLIMYIHLKNNPVELKKQFDKFERLERASLTVDEKLKYIRLRNEVYTHYRKYIYD